MEQSKDTNARYVIEYLPIDAEAPKIYWTPNLEHAKQKAETMTLEGRYKNIVVHEVTINNTWKSISKVFFEEANEEF